MQIINVKFTHNKMFIIDLYAYWGLTNYQKIVLLVFNLSFKI